MTRTDRALGAVRLRQLRESRGWSWTDLARALRDTAAGLGVGSLDGRQVSSIQRSVARWESATDRTSPGHRYQILLANLYARTAEGLLTLGAGSDFAVLVEALRYFGVSEERIDQVTGLVAAADSTERGYGPLALLTPSMGTSITADPAWTTS